jgi:hypothetical protein
LANNASDTCAVLSMAYGGEALKESNVFKWHKLFKEGCKKVEDDERSGCPRSYRTNEMVEKVQNLVHSNRLSSIRAMTAMKKSEKVCTLAQQLDSLP